MPQSVYYVQILGSLFPFSVFIFSTFEKFYSVAFLEIMIHAWKIAFALFPAMQVNDWISDSRWLYVTVFIAIVINKSRTNLSFNMTRDLKTSIKPNLGRDITTHKKWGLHKAFKENCLISWRCSALILELREVDIGKDNQRITLSSYFKLYLSYQFIKKITGCQLIMRYQVPLKH